MENLVPLGTGNSRFMKSNIPSSTTLAQLIQMLNNGTFPYDIGTINPAGISQQGTPLNKDTLLKDETANLLEIDPEQSTPDDAFRALLRAIRGSQVGIYVKAGSVPIVGATVQGVTSLTGKDLITDESGYCVGFAPRGSVEVTLPKEFEDLPEKKQTIVVNDDLDYQEFTIDVVPEVSGEITLTESRNVRFSAATPNIDVFAVGGGGSGGIAIADTSTGDNKIAVASGGAGGYTKTRLGVAHNNQTLTCIVGAGGAARARSTNGSSYGASGSASTISQLGITASGGQGGRAGTGAGGTNKQGDAPGASGGSGSGGAAAYQRPNQDGTASVGDSGYDGANGDEANADGYTTAGGTGQGTTTREWGQPHGTLYSGAGGGAALTSEDSASTVGSEGGGGNGETREQYVGSGKPNTGGGGGGLAIKTESSAESGAGGSGIIKIRWGYQA